MKKIHIVLIVLAVVAVVLLLTQKLWAPSVSVVPNGMDSWNWVFSEISPEGIRFSYPSPLPTKFVSAQNWPPVVEVMVSAFSCTEGDLVAENGSQKHLLRRQIGGHTYCVATSAEGAAGSTYTSYEYSTAQGASVARAVFTLRTPQCLNYDEPERAACTAEQANFNTDALADRIVSSIQTK